MARKLLRTAPNGSEVILFGSRARGDASPESDVDFLVVEPTFADRHREVGRLRRALKGSAVGVDILLATRETFDKWKHTPNSIYCDIAKERQRFAELG